MPHLDAALAIAEHFPRHDGRAHAADEGKRGERRDRDCDGDQGKQDDRAERPSTDVSAAAAFTRFRRGLAARKSFMDGLFVVAARHTLVCAKR